MPNPVGRPRISKKVINDIVDEFEKYIDTAYEEETLPTQYDFWYRIVKPKYKIAMSTFYAIEEFSESRKRCNDAQKEYLMHQGIQDKVNVTMSIFLLKNLGMSDRQDIAITTPEGIKVHWE